MHSPFTLWMNFLHVEMMCITDLHDCVISYTIILYALYAFDIFHILLSGDSLRDLWNIYIYICVYHLISSPPGLLNPPKAKLKINGDKACPF